MISSIIDLLRSGSRFHLFFRLLLAYSSYLESRFSFVVAWFLLRRCLLDGFLQVCVYLCICLTFGLLLKNGVQQF